MSQITGKCMARKEEAIENIVVPMTLLWLVLECEMWCVCLQSGFVTGTFGLFAVLQNVQLLLCSTASSRASGI